MGSTGTTPVGLHACLRAFERPAQPGPCARGGGWHGRSKHTGPYGGFLSKTKHEAPTQTYPWSLVGLQHGGFEADAT